MERHDSIEAALKILGDTYRTVNLMVGIPGRTMDEPTLYRDRSMTISEYLAGSYMDEHGEEMLLVHLNDDPVDVIQFNTGALLVPTGSPVVRQVLWVM